ncbi:MAG: hypothetical protein R2722_15990 [Tessaracoccus sp.]
MAAQLASGAALGLAVFFAETRRALSFPAVSRTILIGTTTNTTMSLAPFGWLVAYWVPIALISASLVAATRSITLAVVPMLVWTVGLSAMIVE